LSRCQRCPLASVHYAKAAQDGNKQKVVNDHEVPFEIAVFSSFPLAFAAVTSDGDL